MRGGFYDRWLLAGVYWFLLGMAWAPGSRIYQQGLVALLWLPVALCAWPARAQWQALWQRRGSGLVALAGLLVWALFSLSWSTADDLGREAKRVLYVVLFLGSFVLVAGAEPERLARVLRTSGLGLALAALASIVVFYGVSGQPWPARLEGIGHLQNPILGGYVMGVAALWLLCLPHERGGWRMAAVAGVLLLVVYMALTQSRGVWLAFVATAVSIPLCCPGRGSWRFSVALLGCTVFGLILFEPLVMERGTSYRPEIAEAALAMIRENPVLGLGIGADYRIQVPELGLAFQHSHNLFTHVAIELGLPGLLLWSIVWGWVGFDAWRARFSILGGCLLAMWGYATFVLMFDGASLLDSPRPAWMLSWLLVALWLVLPGGGRAAASVPSSAAAGR
ncbi:O-antigen ligase family protein [Thauera butanivorans]|uniref:O-antigen ligase family protein n=1 Tax=Thauera butanivorans TaxID=86174 RepID=UPI000837CA40|nr:O-antigen ligase family protein [Thauera butanivorans]